MPQIPLQPWWQTTDGETVRLYLGNVLDTLKRMEAGSVHCAITSPPYFRPARLRDGDVGGRKQGLRPQETTSRCPA